MRSPRGSYSFEEHLLKRNRYLPPPTPSEQRAMRTTTMPKDKAYVTTSEFVLMYPHLTEHDIFEGSDTGQYTITLSYDKDSEIAKEIQTAVEEVDLSEGSGYNPIKEVDGGLQVKTKSKFEVKCLDTKEKTISPGAFKPGDICRAQLQFRPWRNEKGVTCYLLSLQRIRDGEGDLDLPPY